MNTYEEATENNINNEEERRRSVNPFLTSTCKCLYKQHFSNRDHAEAGYGSHLPW